MIQSYTQRSILLVLAATLWTAGFAQNRLQSEFLSASSDYNWVKLKADVKVGAHTYFDRYKKEMGFDEDHELVIADVKTDQIGFTHYRAKQYYRGYPVEGAEYILHEKDNQVKHANGRLVKGSMPETDAGHIIDAAEAISLAKAYFNADAYFWEMPEMEALIKRIKKDEQASWRPEPQLVWADLNYSQRADQYTLAWKMEINATDPVGSKEIFIDASSGAVLYTLDRCQHSNGGGNGVAETRYHGTQNISTTEVAPDEFHLRDYSRGVGIETYDMNRGTDYTQAVDFVDDDNYWDNANPQLDDAATDVHWGMEQTYDYFMNRQNRNSFDDKGSTIVSYVHYSNNWFNARWRGTFAEFGDGNGNPLTSIDVVSHELTHGVTRFSSDLVYRNESGALNESFSDIFGNVVEAYALGNEADWLIGKVNFTLRDMSNPKSFDDPDTYQGANWLDGGDDNGGVHTNSGVQNYWFYLLAEGGSGINDNGEPFSVNALGIDKAADIAYRNLVFYLTPSSQYTDARAGALQSAADLYGTCSAEVIETAKAWHAVGVGPVDISKDLKLAEVLAPQSGCSSAQNSQIIVSLQSNATGCELLFESGTAIELGYRINGVDAVTETLTLTEDLLENESITYTFNTPYSFNDAGEYSIDVWVHADDDNIPVNDTIFEHEIRVPETIVSEHTITFEPQMGGISLDSFYIEKGEEADDILVFSPAASAGLRYMQFTGTNITIGSPPPFPTNKEEVFTLNPEYNIRLCACVDLPAWDNAFLDFDIQQTWSRLYADTFGVATADSLIGLRVLVDDQQVGPSFHPTEYRDLTWETKTVDLSDFVGTSFTLCLEGKHYISPSRDNLIEDSFGDKTNIDQIRISPFTTTSTTELLPSALQITPNPVGSTALVQLDEHWQGDIDIRVVNGLGQEVLRQTVSQPAGSGRFELDVQNLPPGTYHCILSDGIRRAMGAFSKL